MGFSALQHTTQIGSTKGLKKKKKGGLPTKLGSTHDIVIHTQMMTKHNSKIFGI